MTLTPFPYAGRPCPLEKYLTILAHGWVVRILWHLFRSSEPLRFAELQRALDGVSAKVLTQKLRLLEGEGIIQREVGMTSPPQVCYSITDRGRSLLPVYQAMEAAAFDLYGRLEDR